MASFNVKSEPMPRGRPMGFSDAKWEDCPLIEKALIIRDNVGMVAKTHETSITSTYNTKHGFSKVTSCTGEFFQNLYDYARKGCTDGILTSRKMSQAVDGRSAGSTTLKETAYWLNEDARVQITPTDQGRRTRLAFAQLWDGALNNSHLLLHSKKGDGRGNVGGYGEGFKVAANSLLGQFAACSVEPCQVWMVMNSRTWRFCYKEFKPDYLTTSSEKIEQLVVEEYKTQKALGGMVVFIDIPMAPTSLNKFWNPNHYIPTTPLADWIPLLPAGELPVMSYVRFLDDSNAPSQVFQLGIYVGEMHGSKGTLFNEGGSVNIGRDRANTGRIISNIRSAIAKRVTLLPDGIEDIDVMEHLMLHPAALGHESRFGERLLYDSVVAYVRGRDGVPDTTEIFIVDPSEADQVTGRLDGADVEVHVVGAGEELWTYGSNRDLSDDIMIKTFTELPGSERRNFQEELKILDTISPSGCEWVLGEWPADTFKDYMGQSKRYFEHTRSGRNLVPAKYLRGRAYFTGLCLDAWGLSGLDPLIFIENVSSGLTENRMKVIVKKAKQQAASGARLLVGLDTSILDTDSDPGPGTSLTDAVDEPRGGWCDPGLSEKRLRPVVDDERQQAPPGQFYVIGVGETPDTSPAGMGKAFSGGGGRSSNGDCGGSGGGGASADSEGLPLPFPTVSEIQEQVRCAMQGKVHQWVDEMSDAFHRRTTNLPELLAQVFLQCQALVARHHQKHAAFFLGQETLNGAQSNIMDRDTANFMLRHLRRHHRALYPLAHGGSLDTACREVVRELAGMLSLSTERNVKLEVNFLNETGVQEVIKAYLPILVDVTLNPPLAFGTDCGHINGFNTEVHAYSVDGDVVHPGETCVVVFPELLGELEAGKGLRPIDKKYILPMTVASGETAA